MPVKHDNAPPPNFALAKTYLTSISADPNDQAAFLPHKVFNIASDGLLAGKRFDAVKLAGWRYVFRGLDQQYHVVEISVDEASDIHAFHHINTGRHLNNFIALYEQIQNHSEVREKEYVINILRAPACYVLAVWFMGADHEHEFFIPLAPVHSQFEAGRPYEADEFMNLLEKVGRSMASSPVPASLPAAVEDELTRIEGIGPKISTLLKDAGYASFAQIAKASPRDLEAVLATGGTQYNLADATSWPEQAALAAAGKWEELQKLQNELKGGRLRDKE